MMLKGLQMSGTFLRHGAAAAIAACLVVAGAAQAQSREFPSGVSIITQPSAMRKPTFPQAGGVKETLVKEGDKVPAGAVMVRQDTDLDEKEAERLKVEAESDARVEAARAEKDVRTIEYDRKASNPKAYP